MRPRILVAGIGNIFLGDDAFGCEAVQRLSGRALPEGVRVVDYGIRGFDLAFALLEDYEAFILVDAAPRGEAPGTLYAIEVDMAALDATSAEDMMVETHGMNPMKVLAMVKAMGGNPRRVLLVGCEPTPCESGAEEEQMGLSGPVQAALDTAVMMIESLASNLTKKEGDEHEQRIESTGNHSSGGGDHRRVA
jgi:hydrogenase maturation protease